MASPQAESQAFLKAAGFYTAVVDGIWGPQSEAAYNALLQSTLTQDAPYQVKKLAWGSKVSQAFTRRVLQMALDLKMQPVGAQFIMGSIAWESGETFSPSILNGAGSGACGLIQFMPSTATGLGTTTALLRAMSAEQQLEYVYKYFKPYTGRLKNLGDVYMSILWPAGIGKADDWTLWDGARQQTLYFQNRGLDVNKDNKISRGECIAKVRNLLIKGLVDNRACVV